MEISSPIGSQCYCKKQDPNRTFSASEIRLAAISESQSLDMNLVTAEGDKVSLSYDAHAAAFYAESGKVKAEGDDLTVEWAEFSAGQYERELNLHVEGDLNAQEKREIHKVIQTIGQMLKKFVQGRVRPMMKKVEKLSGLETISSLNVDMAYERQVVTARQTEMTLAYDQRGDVLSRPAKPNAFVKETLKESLQAESAFLANEIAEVVQAARAPHEEMLAMTERMLDMQRKEMAQADTLVAELFDHIKDQLQALLIADEAMNAT